MQSRWIASLLLTALAVSNNVTMNPRFWEASITAASSASCEANFKVLTKVDLIPKWFSWIKDFEPIDDKPLGSGKIFQAVVKLPVFGEVTLPLKLSQYTASRLIVFESDTFLKPRFELAVAPNDTGSHLEMKLSYQKPSLLFQVTIAPLLKFITVHQLQRNQIFLRTMVLHA